MLRLTLQWLVKAKLTQLEALDRARTAGIFRNQSK
jgi:hypothetical protein